MKIIRELAKFNHIKYYDKPHKYYIDGKILSPEHGVLYNILGTYDVAALRVNINLLSANQIKLLGEKKIQRKVFFQNLLALLDFLNLE